MIIRLTDVEEFGFDFIKEPKECDIYINTDSIVSMRRSSSIATELSLNTSRFSFYVKETPEQILEMINDC